MGNEIKQVSCSGGTATLAQKIDRVALERVYGLAIMYKTQKKKRRHKDSFEGLQGLLKRNVRQRSMLNSIEKVLNKIRCLVTFVLRF